MKRLLLAAAVVCAGLVGAPVSAQAATGSEAISVRTLKQGDQTIRYVEAEGPITGAGMETIVGQVPLGKNVTQTSVRWGFAQGDVFATMTIQQTLLSQGPPACVVQVLLSGTFQITGGTGAFGGASGSGTLNGVGRVFLTFVPATGKCVGPPTSRAALRYMNGTASAPSTSSAESADEEVSAT